MDLMSLTARDLSNKCLEAFRICLTFHSIDPGLSNQHVPHDEPFEYRLADFNLWIDGIGALAPSKASLDARLSERPIDLSLVKGNLVMLFQSLEDCLNLLKDNESLQDALLDIDSALESLVTLSLAIRRTGRRSRLHKADRLFKLEEHTQLRKHLEAIILLRPGPGPCYQDDEFQTKMKSLTPLQSHLVTANLKRRNRFIQAQLHSLGLKKRTVGFELPVLEAVEQASNPDPSSSGGKGEIAVPLASDTPEQARKPMQAPMSVTSASIPESKLEYKEPISKRMESTPMTVITQITASARYPRPRVSDNEQKVVQCPCCCQTLPVAEAKNNSRWSGPVYSTMTEMMDHLHNTHPQANGEDISAIISSSAQTRMGIESCPLCEAKGDADSPELIDHVLEHVHDFSLRSLPWPRSSEADVGGEVGSFNPQRDKAASITQWLDVYAHETEDIDPTLKLTSCDYGRLAIITEQIGSEGQDKLGLDIGFADEHGDESAEAETDVSQLTQDILESVKQTRDVVFCHECSAEWYRDENGLTCPKCQSELVEIIEPENDAHLSADSSASFPVEPRPSISSARESTSGFRRLTNRLFSRKTAHDVEPQHGQDADKNLIQYLGLKQKAVANQRAWRILTSLYRRRLDSPTKTQMMFENFIRDVQHEDPLTTHPSVSDPDSFIEVMIGFYLNPLKPLPPKDLTKPISNYFINSSYRTLLHTLSGSRSAYDAIQEVLYFGYRSIDLDVWNGTTDTEEPVLQANQPREAKPGKTVKTINQLFGLNRATNALKPVAPKTTVSQSGHLSSPAEPIVTDGYTLMTPCGFREACQVIRNSAFVSTDLPVIINLEVHADSGQQEMMVQIMREEWHDSLIDEPVEGCDPRFRLPKLEDLRGRILVRLSTITSPFLPNSGEPGNALQGESHHKPGRIPIIQPLAELGVYMRRERFENFNTPQTKSPTYVFSLKESKVQELISASPSDLFRHNQNYFSRVYPNSTRQDSSNLDPLRFWRHGIQMAAITRHNVDEGMMLNEGMFANESGWVLKPDGYRSSNKNIPTDLEAAPRKGLDLTIFAFQGQEFVTSTNRQYKDLSSLLRASLYIDDDEKNGRVLEARLTATDIDSGFWGYEFNFHVTKPEASIIPKLSILR
ncbi:hypothetical protein FOBRF1_016685 [Fusarium oxysporum]